MLWCAEEEEDDEGAQLSHQQAPIPAVMGCFAGKGFFPFCIKHPQLGLHHLLLCKCSFWLKPWQEEEKNPRQGTTVSLHLFLEKAFGLQRNT